MSDNIIDKFKVSEKDKQMVKDLFCQMIDKNFDIYASSYKDIFKGMPYSVLESMTTEQATDLVSTVVKEAMQGLVSQMDKAAEAMQNFVKDDEKMEKLKKEFLDKLQGESKMEAEVTEVPKNTMKEEEE